MERGGELRVSRECGWMTYLYNSCGFPPGFLTIPQVVFVQIIDAIPPKIRLYNLPQKGYTVHHLYTVPPPPMLWAVYSAIAGGVGRVAQALYCIYRLYTLYYFFLKL